MASCAGVVRQQHEITYRTAVPLHAVFTFDPTSSGMPKSLPCQR